MSLNCCREACSSNGSDDGRQQEDRDQGERVTQPYDDESRHPGDRDRDESRGYGPSSQRGLTQAQTPKPPRMSVTVFANSA
jgi:hypothetical protein